MYHMIFKIQPPGLVLTVVGHKQDLMNLQANLLLQVDEGRVWLMLLHKSLSQKHRVQKDLSLRLNQTKFRNTHHLDLNQ